MAALLSRWTGPLLLPPGQRHCCSCLERLMALALALQPADGEAAAAAAVLLALVLAAALLSYFVVAPECEKRLGRQLLGQRSLRGLLDWDIEAGSCADGAPTFETDAAGPKTETQPAAGPQGAARAPLLHARSAEALPRSSRGASRRSGARLTRRRKSESDALKEANRARAEMLRRRVALRKLELEIERSKVANDELSASGLGGVPEQLTRLLDHPPACESELATLTAFKPGSELPAGFVDAIRTMHDVLALHLSAAFRDVNKVTIFCNALLQHDGLDRLRALEAEASGDVRALANAIIEMAVPAIWT